MKKFYKDKAGRFDVDTLYYFFGEDKDDAEINGGWYIDKNKKEMLRECRTYSKREFLYLQLYPNESH